MRKYLLIGLFLVAATVGIGAVPPQANAPKIENMATSGPAAVGDAGRIYFVAGDTEAVFHIYSITGQLIKTVKVAADARVAVDMPKGFYIVRYNSSWSRKVVVK